MSGAISPVTKHGRRAFRTGRQAIRNLGRALRRRSILSGLLMAVAKFLVLLGISLITLHSYALWGSESSPLRYLLWPGCICIFAALVLRLILSRYMRSIHRATQIDRRRQKIRQKIRFSKMSVRKLSPDQP